MHTSLASSHSRHTNGRHSHVSLGHAASLLHNTQQVLKGEWTEGKTALGSPSLHKYRERKGGGPRDQRMKGRAVTAYTGAPIPRT